MTYTWFKIFNSAAFIALGLVSRTYVLNLEGLGEQSILVTKGVNLGMTYDGVFLSLAAGETQFAFDGHAMYLDEPTGDVYLGIEVEVEN